jgi:uncharacterized protein
MSNLIDISRNNLEKALSPYLRQHADNPIHWQEWSKEILNIAKQYQKKIFVSIGYSTCHWCHVMAKEAFSNQEIAHYLNEHFISIKVDREQRPDIDQYFMSFIQSTTGRGGWPLNVFLSPKADPIIAFTYMPVESRYGMPAMIDLLQSIQKTGKGIPFTYTYDSTKAKETSLESLIQAILLSYDDTYGGFGSGNKFPSASTLLFLISYYERYMDDAVKKIIEHTLFKMMTRGMYDHLQGGFFRYCVDRKWTIPHFEKMLYDQAMLLWTYSWGYRVFKQEAFRTTIMGIIKCLNESFLEDGLYVSAHDADTNHVEGATYLWSYDELHDVLTPPELSYLINYYEISKIGNFEGKNHLIRKSVGDYGTVEEKLLKLRKKRLQPFIDRKIITSWNALTGIAFVMAWRALGERSLVNQAEIILKKLVQNHVVENVVAHSSYDGVLQRQEFLEDVSSLLLLATYIYEEKRSNKRVLLWLRKKVNEFYDGGWFESAAHDFCQVRALDFDHPFPSSVSLVTMALLRCSILLKEEYQGVPYHRYSGNEFYNLCAFISNGHWHCLHNPSIFSWNDVPLNSIQIKDTSYSDCFEGTCRTRT